MAIEKYRVRRKLKRDKPHLWEVPSANAAWIQNYKVGTRSLRMALARHLWEVDAQKEALTYEQLSHEKMELLDKEYSGFYNLAQFRKKHQGVYLFAFVRHPLARLHSCYMNKLYDRRGQDAKNQFKVWGVDFDTSFDDFVRMVADTPDELSDRHFRSQSWYLKADGEMTVDFVGKLESFVNDWRVLQERFGFPDLPHKNKSTQVALGFREQYTKETYRLAVDRYREDFELLGYDREA